MTNSSEANSGCFSRMLRRLLCTGNLPTHPSDGLSESNGAEFNTLKADAKLGVRAAEPGPGVVARLMGLSSLPDANWVPKQRAPDAVSRSKSVNFADYLLQFDSSQAHHRRVRTSASFREVPPLNPQNDFLVVYMKGSEDNAAEIESNLKKSETSLRREVKEGKEQSSNVKKNTRQSRELTTKKKENERNQVKISKLKDEPRREVGKHFSKHRKCSTSKDSVSVLPSYKQSVPKNGGAVNSKSTQKKLAKQKEAAIGTELNKKTKQKKKNIRHVGKKPEPESDPENSSPVSVLDVGGIDFSDERNSPDMEVGIEKGQNAGDQMEQNGMKNGYCDSNAGDRREGCAEVVGRICRLAEEDIKGANWTVKSAYEFEALEELCMELERHVVNVLLVQTIDDLV